MTFSVSRDMGAFEWAGNNLMTVFCQPSRLLDLEMWRLLYDVIRFNASAQRLIVELDSRKSAKDEELSIGTYLEQNGYSDSFRDNYLIVNPFLSTLYRSDTHHVRQPMTAAIWSTPPDKCALDFPARTLVSILLPNCLMSTAHSCMLSRFNSCTITISCRLPGNRSGSLFVEEGQQMRHPLGSCVVERILFQSNIRSEDLVSIVPLTTAPRDPDRLTDVCSPSEFREDT